MWKWILILAVLAGGAAVGVHYVGDWMNPPEGVVVTTPGAGGLPADRPMVSTPLLVAYGLLGVLALFFVCYLSLFSFLMNNQGPFEAERASMVTFLLTSVVWAVLLLLLFGPVLGGGRGLLPVLWLHLVFWITFVVAVIGFVVLRTLSTRA